MDFDTEIGLLVTQALAVKTCDEVLEVLDHYVVLVSERQDKEATEKT